MAWTCSSGLGSLWSTASSVVVSPRILDMQSGGTVTSPSASVDVHLRRSSIAAGCNDTKITRQYSKTPFLLSPKAEGGPANLVFVFGRSVGRRHRAASSSSSFSFHLGEETWCCGERKASDVVLRAGEPRGHRALSDVTSWPTGFHARNTERIVFQAGPFSSQLRDAPTTRGSFQTRWKWIDRFFFPLPPSSRTGSAAYHRNPRFQPSLPISCNLEPMYRLSRKIGLWYRVTRFSWRIFFSHHSWWMGGFELSFIWT